jgi:TolB protein
MRCRWTFGAALVVSGVVACLVESGATDVFLEATRQDFQKIPIGVLSFRELGPFDRLGEKTALVIKADLRRSQVFSVSDLSALAVRLAGAANDPGPPLFQQASEQGIAVVVWGQLGRRDHDLFLDGYLHDAGSNGAMLGKRYLGDPSYWRLMAHRLADELVYRYTGEQGIARTKVAFVSEQRDSREIFVMDYDGYGAKQVTADGFVDLMPRWSPDRRFLVFTTYRNRSSQDIALIELATGKRTTLVTSEGLNITPIFSPDGATLAFASSRDGNAEIYALNVRTKVQTRLTDHQAGDLSPGWSPNGQEMVFVSDRAGGPQLYLMNADGSNVRRLTFRGDYNAAPVWSPKGNWIAFVCRTEARQYKLCLISPDGQKQMQITNGNGVDDSPSWSPDGRHLVFSSTVEGKSHIYMINSDGTDLERLTSGGAHHSAPAWSPI